MSSPITLSGFNNIDFSQVLTALMAQERIPVTQLTTQQTALSNQKTFFTTFASKLAGLESAVDALTAANAFDGRSATVSDPTAATVQVGGTTPNGSYNVLVSSLAKAQVTGSTSSHTDRNSTIVANGGTLTIGGVNVILNGPVTLDGLVDAINGTANIGVSASVVQNGSNYQLVLTGQQTGAAASFAITNNLTGGAGVALSATNAQDASNAVGTVNGIAFSTPTNTVEGVLPQSTLELVKTAPTNPIVITITGDRGSLKELINKVRLAYNEVVSFIDNQALAAKEKNPASIGRNPLVRDLRSQLARVLNTEQAGPARSRQSRRSASASPGPVSSSSTRRRSTAPWTPTRPACRPCSAAPAGPTAAPSRRSRPQSRPTPPPAGCCRRSSRASTIGS